MLINKVVIRKWYENNGLHFKKMIIQQINIPMNPLKVEPVTVISYTVLGTYCIIGTPSNIM